MKADYSLRLINSIFNEFQKVIECADESFIVQSSFFEITKPFMAIVEPHCKLNEIKLNHFLNIFRKFTDNSLRIVTTLNT